MRYSTASARIKHGYAASALLLGALLLIGLAAPRVVAQPGTVQSHQKISDTEGGFSGTLDDGDNFGFSVATLGDLDGDGVPDLAVGAPLDGDGGVARGAVWVLFMNADGTVRDEQKISATAGGFTGALDDGDLFGGSVGALGDLDGDGVPDLAVGAYLDEDGGTFVNANVGAVWVLFLNTDGTVRGHQKISATEGGFAGSIGDLDNFGRSVAGLGDLDGDGVGDLVAGAFFDGEVFASEGAVYVLFLNADGTVKAHQKIGHTVGGFDGTLSFGDQFGASVAALGDLDGDGVVDLAVGANRADDGGTGFNPAVGAVWVLFMNADGTVRDEQKISATAGGFTGALDDGDLFGRSVAGLGDLDGDGIADLAVGADRDDDGEANTGAVWVLFLNADGTVKAHQKVSAAEGGFTGTLDDSDSFGFSVAGLGDPDGDGVADLAVGALDDDDGGTSRGAVWNLFLDGVPTLASDLILTGVIDGPLSGGTPKAIEVYVANDVADLSLYGLGSANNGGGSDGEEFTFPAVSASAGDYLYVASEATEFTNWFGFAPDYTSSAANINGDDAVELFMNGSVVDTFGDIDIDGSGEPWEYTDGWAYRVSGTGPDGSTFVLENWTFSGPNALDGETTNPTAETPFPTGTYISETDDTMPPSCALVGFRLDPLPRTLNFFLEDTESGLASVEVTGGTTNAVVEIPFGSGNFFNAGELASFSPPETSGFEVQATQVASNTVTSVELTLTDAAGNSTTCSGELPADEPEEDTTPPSCGEIAFEVNNGEYEIVSSATDDTGIASATFTRLTSNLDGYVDDDGANGPFAQGATYTTGEPDPLSIGLRARVTAFSGRFTFLVTVADAAGNTAVCDPVITDLDGTLPEATALAPAYPNPARIGGGSSVRVPFTLAEAADVRVVVYDVLGREVAVLAESEMAAGSYEVAWPEAAGLAPGTYVVRLEAGAYRETQRLTLVH